MERKTELMMKERMDKYVKMSWHTNLESLFNLSENNINFLIKNMNFALKVMTHTLMWAYLQAAGLQMVSDIKVHTKKRCIIEFFHAE